MAFLFIESSPETGSSSVLQNAAQAVKLLLLVAGVASTALMVRGAFMSFSCEIVFSNLVGFWTSIVCILSSPLYICIIINSIVLLIAASSSFHRHDPQQPPPPEKSPTSTLYEGSDHDDDHDLIPSTFHHGRCCDHHPSAVPLPPEKSSAAALYQGGGHDREGGGHDRDVILSTFHHHGSYDHHPSRMPLPHHDLIPSTLHHRETYDHHPSIMPPPSEKTSTLYEGNYDSDILHYASPATKKIGAEEMTINQLDERESEEDDTMEATWEAITGTKTKQLQKSETFHEQLPRAAASSWKDLRKSETFNESVSKRRVGGLMRDPSIGIDEFNEQVEAFIKKFNADMRLQRQESDQRFLDMIKKGSL